MNNKPLTLVAFQILTTFSFLITSTFTSPIPNYDLSLMILNPKKTGFTIKGNAIDDYFGTSPTTAGDVNGDGYNDIIVGAYLKNNRKGEVYVIYGGPTSLLSDLDLSSTSLDPATTGFTITGNLPTSDFGVSLSAAGDVNNDGYDDIIIGAPATNQAFVIYGQHTSLHQNIALDLMALDPATTGFTMKGSGSFGTSVSTAGDIDGDGIADIIIGASAMNSFQGAAYVIYGKNKSDQKHIDLTSLVLDPAVNGFMITGDASSDFFGGNVRTAGDVDGDGLADVLIGAMSKNADQGAAYVIYGKPRSAIQNVIISPSLNPVTTGFYITGMASGSRLASSLDTAGDINNDGFDDIIIGASQELVSRGAAYLIYGGSKSSRQNIALGSMTLDPLITGFRVFGGADHEFLGASVNTARDLNGDGYDDILVMATGYNSAQGAVYIIYGGEKSDLPNIDFSSTTLDPSTTGFIIKGQTPGDYFSQIGPVGDVNGDGYPDIIIGVPSAYTGQSIIGKAFVIHSSCVTTDSSPCSERGFCKTCVEQANPADTQCQVCPANCQEYLGKTSCQVCNQGYFISNSQCTKSCPGGSFGSEGKCKDCSLHCSSCTSLASCQTCENTYFEHQGGCVSSCPAGTFISGKTCQDCPPHCSSCTSSGSCQVCDSTYLFYKSQCVQTCPSSSFLSSPDTCKDCSLNCASCTSLESCQTCDQGYILTGSQCVISSSSSPSTPSSSTLKTERATAHKIEAGVTGVGSVLCTGNPTFPLTRLVNKIVQNTRYLDLPVTLELQEIYQTWNTDLISWGFPDNLSKLDHFKTAPLVFARYDLASPFLANFWSTIMTMIVSLGCAIVFFVLLLFFERATKSRGWIHSVLRILAAGSFNFAIVQIYGCLDDILLYLVLDIKTNPRNSVFAWTSLACGAAFIGLGALFILMNILKVREYQRIKRQGEAKKDMSALEIFNEKNKNWELFYADFNNYDAWSHSFLAFLVMRNCLSSLIIVALSSHPKIQTISLLVLDGIIISFLFFKKPFATLRGKLAQYYFEVITLLLHICTAILAFHAEKDQPSENLIDTLCTIIIYLNVVLITGTTGFMFIEIYKTISQWAKSQRNNPAAVYPIIEEVSDTSKMLPFKGVMDLTTNHQIETHRTQKGDNTAQAEKFHLLPGFNPSQNISASGVNLQTSEADNSLSPDILNSSDRINPQRNANASSTARRRLLVLTNPQNKSIFTAHGEEIEVTELEIK